VHLKNSILNFLEDDSVDRINKGLKIQKYMTVHWLKKTVMIPHTKPLKFKRKQLKIT